MIGEIFLARIMLETVLPVPLLVLDHPFMFVITACDRSDLRVDSEFSILFAGTYDATQ